MPNIVAFTGAGISKASGIPTFADLGNIRDKLSREFFINNPEEFYEVLLEMKMIIDSSDPNPAHLAIAKYKIPTVTMNVDGLLLRAGTSNIIEIHGNLEYVYCKRCNKKFDFHEVSRSVYCSDCKNLLEPNVVLYGDTIPMYFDAINLIGSADELLVVGTSFYTSTAKDLVGRAELAGIKVTTINDNAEGKVPEYLDKLCSDR